MKAATKKKKTPKGRKVSQPVEFKLTDTQKAEKGMEAAKLQKEVNELVVEKKIASDEYSAKIKSRSSRVATLLTEIDSGVEIKETECVEVKNFDRNRVEFWLDGEIVKERDLTEDDRQLSLEETNAKNKKKQGKVTPVTAEEQAKACVAVPGKQPPRGKRQELEPDADISDVIRAETNRKTKHSPTDGARI